MTVRDDHHPGHGCRAQAQNVEPVSIRAVAVLDDGVFLVRRDGALEPVLAGGHPRPGIAHSTAGRRP